MKREERGKDDVNVKELIALAKRLGLTNTVKLLEDESK